MLTNVIHCDLRVAIIVVIICGIHGHRPERSSSSTIQHMTPLAKDQPIIHNNDISHKSAVKDSLLTDYASLMESSAEHDNENFDSGGKTIFSSNPSEYTTVQLKLEDFSPASCENATFCENPPFYPDDFIKRALAHRNDLKYLAVVDPVPYIDRRMDNGTQDVLCSTATRIVYPRTAKNRADEWVFVVNDDEFRQGVYIDVCSSENAACGVVSDLVVNYETSCKQTYIYRKLVAVNSNGSATSDYFSFPANCCCYVSLRP